MAAENVLNSVESSPWHSRFNEAAAHGRGKPGPPHGAGIRLALAWLQ